MREASDCFAQSLPVQFMNGNITVVPPSALRLLPPQRHDNGAISLTVTNNTGGSLDEALLSRITVLASSDLSIPLEDWSKLDKAPVLTNGVINITDQESKTVRDAGSVYQIKGDFGLKEKPRLNNSRRRING